MLLLCVSCKNAANEEIAALANEEIGLELTDHEVVLLESEYNQFLKSYYDYDAWKPDQKDIASTREIVIKAINSGNFDMFKVSVEEYVLNNYFFQYVPYINENGERIIYVNAFCEITETNSELIIYDIDSLEPIHIDWTQELNQVDDGGACYWQTHVNLDQEIYVDLMINGNA
jgi:hypothetical protein